MDRAMHGSTIRSIGGAWMIGTQRPLSSMRDFDASQPVVACHSDRRSAARSILMMSIME
jgi:hypothetical protein